MGTKQLPDKYDCYTRALSDEPMFTLLARDSSAPGMVRQWAYEREREVAQGKRAADDLEMVAEARRCANAMERWRQDNFGAWRDTAIQPLSATTVERPSG